MAEIRCPMCGKPNSDDLEVCQFCEARLTPLIITPPGEESTRELSSPSRWADRREDEIEGEPEESIPDWLQSLREGGEEEEFSTLSSAEEEFPISRPESSEEELKITPTQAEANYRDWLASLRSGDEEGETLESLPKETPIDWEKSEPEEEAPGWLTDLRSTSEEASFQAPLAETAPLSQPDDPEWLRNLRERQMMEELTPATDEEEQPESLDITAGLSPREQAESFETPEEAAELPEDEEIPDWLSGLVESPSDDHPEDLPQWLVSGEPPPAVPMTPAFIEDQSVEGEPALPLESETEIPDWLSGIINSQARLGSTLQPAEGGAEGERTGAEFEWLEGQDRTAPGKGPADQQPKVVAPFTFDEETASLEADELPDWLREAGAQEMPAEIPSSEEDATLAPAALPAWLEAMRPVEAAAPGAPRAVESERSVESSGPLAGLRGILRAEPDIARQKKPTAYTIKLQVSESHQAHAAILEELISSEGEVTPVASRTTASRQMLWRLAIFILLLLAAALPIYSGSQSVALPQLPAETFAARNIIDQLQKDSRVLVAVDYEPGYAGELNAASAALLDHLMIKGTYLAVVSTLPSGPAQAERLVSVVNREGNHTYTSPAQYSNLGFIPGGMAGLLGFAEAPQQVLPFALDGTPAWTNGQLAGISSLSDFSLAIVLTESPDTARAWIEQVKPALGDAPLLMAISAQAEPLVRPYFDGSPQQVQGMLVGLAGGAAYESGMPRAILARQYWDAYSYTLTAAILIILVASIANSLLGYLSQGKRARGEAQP